MTKRPITDIVIGSTSPSKRKVLTSILESLCLEFSNWRYPGDSVELPIRFKQPSTKILSTVKGGFVEEGEIFSVRSRAKARAFAWTAKKPAIADDSGLIVHALAGKPGVNCHAIGWSPRDILQKMEGETDRSATMVSCCTLWDYKTNSCVASVTSVVDGTIADSKTVPVEDLVEAYGYDGIFEPMVITRPNGLYTRHFKTIKRYMDEANVGDADPYNVCGWEIYPKHTSAKAVTIAALEYYGRKWKRNSGK